MAAFVVHKTLEREEPRNSLTRMVSPYTYCLLYTSILKKKELLQITRDELSDIEGSYEDLDVYKRQVELSLLHFLRLMNVTSAMLF